MDNKKVLIMNEKSLQPFYIYLSDEQIQLLNYLKDEKIDLLNSKIVECNDLY